MCSLTLAPLDADEGAFVCAHSYLRGVPLSANRLVHVAEWGDFQLLQVDGPADPAPLLRRQNQMAADGAVTLLHKPDPQQQVCIHERAHTRV